MVFVFVSTFAFSQAYESFATYSLSVDTMVITRSDGFTAIAVSCPSWATDSVTVNGETVISNDGHTSGTVTLAPGETLTVGSGNNVLNYLQIICADKGRVVILRRRQR